MQVRRLLYLGQAFPPGVSPLFPEKQPAGHLIETNLVRSLQPWLDVRTVGVSEVDLTSLGDVQPTSPGLPHALSLLNRPPALWNWARSLRKLRRTYTAWLSGGWEPDVILACNFSPIYNAFIRQIARQPQRPRLVLYLADSTLLGIHIPLATQLRYRLKPFKWLDDEMADLFDACVAVSRDTEARFQSRNRPWLWLPNGVHPARIRQPSSHQRQGPIVFGYFGSAGEHAGAPQLLRVFCARPRQAQLRVCLFGKARHRLAQQFGGHSGVSFHGPFDPEICLEFGSGCDVLVNPRPLMPDNKNSFPSKVFEYALTGRCILSSRLSGCEIVMGESAHYFDAADFDHSLDTALRHLSATPRDELECRGAKVQQHIAEHYSWATQGERLSAFLTQVLGGTAGG